MSKTIDALWQDILDKDDRNSPEEYPDMALITADEFRDAIEQATSLERLQVIRTISAALGITVSFPDEL